MGTLNKFLSNTHFYLVYMGSVNGFLYQKMVFFGGSFWVYVSTVLVTLFGFINRILFRVKGDENNPTCSVLRLQDNQVDSNHVEGETETEGAKTDIVEFKDTKENEVFDEKESPKFIFKFQFPSYQEYSRSYRENGDNVDLDLVPSTSTNKYEFKSGEDFSGFMEKPEVFSFTVKELYADSNNSSFSNKEIIDNGFLSETDFMRQNREAETVLEEKIENSIDGAYKEEKPKRLEETTLMEESLSGKEKAVDEENKLPNDPDVAEEVQFLAEKEFIALVADSDSIVSSPEFSVLSQFVGSISDGFLSDREFEEAIELDTLRDNNGEKVESTDEDLELEDVNLENLSTGYEADDFDDEDSDIMEELKQLEESRAQNSNTLDSDILSENGIHNNNNSKQAESSGQDNGPTFSSDDSKRSNVQNSEDSNGLETLWEHQDLIEQLKMELKKVRATGLPTILEESESPKIMEDLKPWKIDEKFQHEDTMSELHKFYKSYRERMRKFDILNYQKMYAVGFLQSKDPLKSIASRNSSAPAIKYLLSQNFLLCRRKKSECDPMMKFMRELHGDLEMVYVGQMCLSWDILHWQYEKALELWDSDPYGIRRYNEVAGEFQQFQVLMQRFIENEPFEGPRVQNYVKNRCVLRNLLQVPVIREDNMKDKRKARKKERDDNAITSDMVVEIMEESIRIFWRFVRADKDANNVTQKVRKGTQVEPQEPKDLELFAEVRASLQKKEKKLKDILRSGNCILRKFQKNQEESSDQVLYFFSQVDMKLVARVLNMSKITADQLLWCHNKLSKINFVNRKIHVEPSFSLFPC